MNDSTGHCKHVLPDLPYRHDALEPCIDTQTMQLHHGRHHASYVTQLNAALEDYPALRDRDALWLLCNPDAIPRKIRAIVRNNAGGHLNHSLFWRTMSATSGGAPVGSLAEAIERDFGGFERFKALFIAAGEKQFGSGWVWLVRERPDGGRLRIVTTSGHDTPLVRGRLPILVNDVWEHAYYLRYQDRRSDYLQAWWSIVDWKEAGLRFDHSDQSALTDWEDEGGRVAG